MKRKTGYKNKPQTLILGALKALDNNNYDRTKKRTILLNITTLPNSGPLRTLREALCKESLFNTPIYLEGSNFIVEFINNGNSINVLWKVSEVYCRKISAYLLSHKFQLPNELIQKILNFN